MTKAPRRALHPDFQQAFTLSKVRVAELATAIGMPKTSLGRVMASAEVRVTPLMQQRLQALADLLWYGGNLYR